MPRNGQGVYSKPPGTAGSPNTPIESGKYNATVDDLVNDANSIRPIVYGGTGVATRSEFRQTFSVPVYIAGITELKALDIAQDKSAFVTQDGISGQYAWRLGDYSSQIAEDLEERYFIKSNLAASSAGAWVRIEQIVNGSFADAWSSTKNYAARERVVYDGTVWFALIPNINKIPGADSTNWKVALGPLSGSTQLVRKLKLGPSTVAEASLNLPQGNPPTSPVIGDVWTEGTRLKYRVNALFTNDLMQPLVPLSWPTGFSIETVVASTSTWLSSPNTAVIPYTNVLPLVADGFQFLQGNYTPRQTTSNVTIEFTGFLTLSAPAGIVIAIFVDGVCVAAGAESMPSGSLARNITLRSKQLFFADLAAKSIQVRIGCTVTGVATIHLNGNSTNALFGGAASSSLRVIETSVYTA